MGRLWRTGAEKQGLWMTQKWPAWYLQKKDFSFEERIVQCISFLKDILVNFLLFKVREGRAARARLGFGHMLRSGRSDSG